jgi:hypothetical protein
VKFKFWSDTNMVNAVARLESAGVDFTPDLLKSVVEIGNTDIRARDMLQDEGGEEWFG